MRQTEQRGGDFFFFFLRGNLTKLLATDTYYYSSTNSTQYYVNGDLKVGILQVGIRRTNAYPPQFASLLELGGSKRQRSFSSDQRGMILSDCVPTLYNILCRERRGGSTSSAHGRRGSRAQELGSNLDQDGPLQAATRLWPSSMLETLDETAYLGVGTIPTQKVRVVVWGCGRGSCCVVLLLAYPARVSRFPFLGPSLRLGFTSIQAPWLSTRTL